MVKKSQNLVNVVCERPPKVRSKVRYLGSSNLFKLQFSNSFQRLFNYLNFLSFIPRSAYEICLRLVCDRIEFKYWYGSHNFFCRNQNYIFHQFRLLSNGRFENLKLKIFFQNYLKLFITYLIWNLNSGTLF